MKKYIKETAVALILTISVICFPAYRSEASIPTFRLDIEEEMAQLHNFIERLNYVKSVLTNLEGLQAIGDLKNLYSQITGYLDEVKNLQSKIDGMKGQLEGMFDGIGNNLLNVDISSVLASGKINGKAMDDFGSEVPVLLKAGDTMQAATILTDRSKKTIEEQYKLSVSDDKKDEDAIKTALSVTKEAMPISFPGMQEGLAKLAIESDGSTNAQSLFALDMADASRIGMIQEITKVMSPYTVAHDSEVSYRAALKKLEEQNSKALKKTQDVSKGGPSEALRAIAAMSAVMVEQIGLQNQILIRWADVLADDIKMSGLVALTGVEPYTNALGSNLQRYIDAYHKMSQR